MKVTKSYIKQLIKEELEAVLRETRILDKFKKDKEEELKQMMRDMGKDPDDTMASLGAHGTSVIGQSLVDDYPGVYDTPKSPIDMAVKEMAKFLGDSPSYRLKDFYDIKDSDGESVFSRVVALMPDLVRYNPSVKRAIQRAGGDPKNVTTKIGKRKAFHHIRKHIQIRAKQKEQSSVLDQYK